MWLRNKSGGVRGTNPDNGEGAVLRRRRLPIPAQGNTLGQLQPLSPTLKGLTRPFSKALLAHPFRVKNHLGHPPRVAPWAEIGERLRRYSELGDRALISRFGPLIEFKPSQPALRLRHRFNQLSDDLIRINLLCLSLEIQQHAMP